MKVSSSFSFFFDLIKKTVLLSSNYDDGTFIFTDISGGKLQVGTGSGTLGNGFSSGTLFVGVANIPSSFDGKTITVISYNSLRSTSGLTGVIIPTTIEEIHDRAFRENSNLQFVNFTHPSSLKSIGSYSFSYLNIIETFIIPSTVESIGSYAFRSCLLLTNFYYCGSSDLRTISNCFTNSPLVNTVIVTSIYPYSSFASTTTVVSECHIYYSPISSENIISQTFFRCSICHPYPFHLSLVLSLFFSLVFSSLPQ